VSFVRQAVDGALGGFGGTLVLTGFREALARVGAVGTSAPQQVVSRLEELGLVDDWSPGARRVLVAAAHLSYGVGIGAVMGLLRRESGSKVGEAAAGAALGLLAWGAGWSAWLPLTGVDLPPWKEPTPKVLLPVLDHAVFGAAWGLLYKIVRPDRG
jgi:hypothetical protein